MVRGAGSATAPPVHERAIDSDLLLLFISPRTPELKLMVVVYCSML